jgi:hypothetical protein
MARSCTICIHRNRDGMDKLLLRGEQLTSVARRYSVSEDALGRHEKHMQVVIEKPRPRFDFVVGSSSTTDAIVVAGVPRVSQQFSWPNIPVPVTGF